MKQLLVVGVLSLCALAACMKTQFYGDAHYPGGARACATSCASQNMEMSGFVYTGEFASSCVCRLRTTAPRPATDAEAAQAAADTAAVVGVQKRANNGGTTSGQQ